MFNQDLEMGKRYEQETIKYLDFDDFRYSLGKCKEWDIEITKDGVKQYIEVKADRKAYKTGNICIEYEYNGYPSGINATIAEVFFIYVVHDDNLKLYEVYKVPTDYIKDLIQNKKYFISCNGGDFNKSKMYLFKKEIFNDYKINI